MLTLVTPVLRSRDRQIMDSPWPASLAKSSELLIQQGTLPQGKKVEMTEEGT